MFNKCIRKAAISLFTFSRRHFITDHEHTEFKQFSFQILKVTTLHSHIKQWYITSAPISKPPPSPAIPIADGADHSTKTNTAHIRLSENSVGRIIQCERNTVKLV